jgi:hypothetical protein
MRGPPSEPSDDYPSGFLEQAFNIFQVGGSEALLEFIYSHLKWNRLPADGTQQVRLGVGLVFPEKGNFAVRAKKMLGGHESES